MTRRRFNPDAEPALLQREESSVKYKRGESSPLIIDIRGSALYPGNEHIAARAGHTWSMLTDEEKHEYSLRSRSLPISGFELFMLDYISLSNPETGVDIETLLKKTATRH